ncbi:MAG: 2Fe-2S iron-sulfur cluster binding domain-containing protein [Pseudomonadales bacterium]|nr:(2Fe-2S)-binding protein [Pseudomonadales bacterium]NIX08900.1 2Fe-2S iron-sulfur cluster binding domain-containing protein [Pseudomonadales bacterium]
MATTLTVNGIPVTTDADPATPLIFVLRNDLGLFGAKLGCGLEQCGSCLVLVDGEPVYSCTASLDSLGGQEIETVESLSRDGQPDALQQAFLDENAAQCGYCTAGIIMAAKALLARKPDPSRADIVEALEAHLCRCGAHPRIIRAIQRAAASAKTS